MLRMAPELIIGPLLVGAATLAARRWGVRVAGVVSALPAVVGPVLLITATQRGAAFAGQAADGTLLGLVGLSGFVAAYAQIAIRAHWGISLLTGWICAAVISVSLGWLAAGGGVLRGLVAAVLSLLLAHRTMPRAPVDFRPDPPGWNGVIVRMAVTAGLVGLLATVAVLVGPLLGGMLAALPLLASVLAVFTHRRAGAPAAVALLRGMLAGMTGFAGFCAVVGGLIVPMGPAWAFTVAALTAIGLQLLVLAPHEVLLLLRFMSARPGHGPGSAGAGQAG